MNKNKTKIYGENGKIMLELIQVKEKLDNIFAKLHNKFIKKKNGISY